MRKLTIDRALFQEAFEMGDLDAAAFLDSETGDVIIISHDEWHAIDDSEYSETAGEALNTTLAEQIYNERDTRYLSIEKQDSPDGYRDMQAFIADLDDDHVREVLETAIQGSGAFRRFKDVLYRQPDVQKAWFAFRDERIAMRMKQWFEYHDIEVNFV